MAEQAAVLIDSFRTAPPPVPCDVIRFVLCTVSLLWTELAMIFGRLSQDDRRNFTIWFNHVRKAVSEGAVQRPCGAARRCSQIGRKWVGARGGREGEKREEGTGGRRGRRRTRRAKKRPTGERETTRQVFTSARKGVKYQTARCR